MFTSNILDACLEGHILSDNMPDHSEEFNNFRIIEEDSGRLVKGSLHIGSARALYSAVRADWDRDYVYTVIITGGDSVMDYFNESPGFHIIATDMPVTEVVNNLSELADRYSRMYSLRRHLHSSVSVADPIIEGAAEAMNADVFYLNGRMRVMSLSRAVNCPLFANIEVSSHLELSHAVTPKDEWTIDGEWAMRLSPLDYEGHTSAYLFVIVHKDTGQRFNSELMDQLYMSMEEFLHITFSDRSVADARFTTLAMDLLDGKINDEELLDERLRRISYSFTSHYFLIVIESETITKRVDAEVIPLLTSIYSGGFRGKEAQMICFPAKDRKRVIFLLQFPRQEAAEQTGAEYGHGLFLFRPEYAGFFGFPEFHGSQLYSADIDGFSELPKFAFCLARRIAAGGKHVRQRRYLVEELPCPVHIAVSRGLHKSLRVQLQRTRGNAVGGLFIYAEFFTLRKLSLREHLLLFIDVC